MVGHHLSEIADAGQHPASYFSSPHTSVGITLAARMLQFALNGRMRFQ